jgi:hypothetical protein
VFPWNAENVHEQLDFHIRSGGVEYTICLVKEGTLRKLFLMVLIAVLTFCSVASAETVLPNRHFFLSASNVGGIKWDYDYSYYNVSPPPGGLAYSTNDLPGIAPGTYFMKADGGGQNELGLTDVSDPLYPKKVVAVDSPTTSSSGTFFVTNTGGRGYDDDIILLLSVKGPIPDDFSVHITSSGYSWTPVPDGSAPPAVVTGYSYVPSALDATFTKADFMYGPQTFRPSPGGTAGTPCTQAMYYGQDASDTSEYHMMFIDLNAGNLKDASYPGLNNNGALKIDYTITGMASIAAFNGYGWCSASNQGAGINWTNNTTLGAFNASGYKISYTGPPVVISTTPIDGATNIPITTSAITATFNTPMDGNTITANSFTVQDQNGQAFSGTITFDAASNTATFTPLSPFSYGKTYTVTISSDVKDLSANALSAKTWTFNTGFENGDVTGDGKVDISDALMSLQFAAGRQTPTAQQMALGDLAPMSNGVSQPDGKIDIGDVMVILLKVINQ